MRQEFWVWVGFGDVLCAYIDLNIHRHIITTTSIPSTHQPSHPPFGINFEQGLEEY
jgi:hypothetical protein